MITDEMVEAACVALFAADWNAADEDARQEFRADMRRALEAAEALQPKLVEVGKVEWDSDGYAIGVLKSELPPGTKLYAEHPKPSDPNNPVDSFGATTA